MNTQEKKDILGLSFTELEDWVVTAGEPKYRASQIFEWIYKKKAFSFSEMKNIPSGLANTLKNHFSLDIPAVEKKIISEKDGTIKYVFTLRDGETIETAVIPSRPLRPLRDNKYTICLSTQAGCRWGCVFCESGRNGFKRNLSAGEILSHILAARKDGYMITNVVFMGIGEPLDNFDHTVKAIRMINDNRAMNIGARRITVSTAGIPEKIEKLASLGLQI